MVIIRVLATVFFVQITIAGLCSSSSIIPFSGYKITRRYKIRIRPVKSEGFLVLTKCHRGIPLFSRTISTSSSHDEFALPFCPENTDFDFSGRRRTNKKTVDNLDSFPNAWATEDGETSTSGLLADRFSRSLNTKKSGFMKWIPSVFGKPILESKDDTRQKGASDKSALVQQKEGQKEESHVIRAPCMKMARRKQYARSDVVIFIPATFVGVLFACSVSENIENIENTGSTGNTKNTKKRDNTEKDLTEASANVLGTFEGRWRSQLSESRADTGQAKGKRNKKKNKKKSKNNDKEGGLDSINYLNKLTGNEKSFTGEPVCPLVADDYSSHWVSVHLTPPALIYHVPYVRSPSLWDPRFKSAQWDEDVDINESYKYSQTEATKISKALVKSSRYISRLFNSKRAKASRIFAFKKHWLEKFDPRLQLSLHLSSMGKPVALRHVIRLQRLWEGLFKAPSGQ